jgi:hypothetical protein
MSNDALLCVGAVIYVIAAMIVRKSATFEVGWCEAPALARSASQPLCAVNGTVKWCDVTVTPCVRATSALAPQNAGFLDERGWPAIC